MSSGGRGRPVVILLVEDNPGDVRLTREAMGYAKVLNQLHVAGDGEVALRFLRRNPPYERAPRPDLILLDLNLPRLDGEEVLAAIKSDPSLRQIPVVVITSSSAEEDIARSYDLHANCYVTKPIDFQQLIQVVRAIDAFWLSIVQLPRDGGEP